MIFDDLFTEYINLNQGLQTDYELYNKKLRFNKYIKPFIGSMSLSYIKYKDCQLIVNNVLNEFNLAPKTAKNINAVVQTVFNYAIMNEYTDKNPATLVKIPKFDNKYHLNISKEQIKDLVDSILAFDNPLYKDIFIFALHGRRKTEILSMTWSQVNFETITYSIPAQKNKSRKNDLHEMTPLLLNMLKARYSKAKEINASKKDDYIFISPATDTCLKDIRKPFAKLKEIACLTNFRFHDFRHLLATYTLNSKKLPIEYISQALGHSSIEVTQRYITKDSLISKIVCEELLNDFI